MTDEIIQLHPSTKRIEFIDALRGCTIFLVVLQHVEHMFLNVNNSVASLNSFFIRIRMPMLFLISGFVLYKEGVVWNFSHIVLFFKKKIPIQLLSPLIFFVVYMHINGYNVLEGFFISSKYGYWFTYALFIYFIIYACARFCLRGITGEIVLVLIGALLLPACWPGFVSQIAVPGDVLSFMSFPQWQYFLFFCNWHFGEKVLCAVPGVVGREMVLAYMCCCLFFRKCLL